MAVSSVVLDANVSGGRDAASVAAIPVPVGSGSGSGSSALASVGGGSGADGSAGSNAIAASGSAGSNDVGATAGSAVGSGTENLAGVDGAPTTAGTAANLNKYFPKGYIVTAMVRFDRLRGTRWQQPAEKIFAPMPDYRVLFGAADANISQRFDVLVISTPSPRDATATTLVAKTKMSRADLRTFLEQPETPVTWSVAQGGMIGSRGGDRKAAKDNRIFFAPFLNWFLLVQPGDVGALTTPAAGELDTAVAQGKLKGWLSKIRSIEAESGDKKGPALIVTIEMKAQTYDVPDVGIGVTSVVAPSRITVAMELVKTGWFVRGNLKFSTEAEATSFVTSAQAALQRVNDSKILQRLLQNSKALNAVQGLSFAQTGDRVSYATSISIGDAEQLLGYAAKTVNKYYGGGGPP
jgi:hypothetical protein